ncbi:MAG TPA: NB-ARC domain-containing protein [Thermomicrobiales bacterium]|nr:NB-ARC domain-containing protein [Thermomicrobiales bacterium]
MADESQRSPGTPTFAQLLRQHRIAAALSQEALAERAGISARAISDLERGVKTRPYLETVRMLADALDLTLPARSELARAARPQSPLVPGKLPEPTPSGLRGVIPLITQTTLVGRDDDIAQIANHLLRDDLRMVTLTGPGGVGKTRLALAAAKAIQAEFPGGVWFIDLTTVTDSTLVPSAMVQALGLSEAGGTPLLDQIVAFLHRKQILLVLDNFEHVIDAAPAIAILIGRQSSAKVMVTSRMPLHISGEQEISVNPLALPEQGSELPDELRDNSAITLFVQRAQAVRPSFTLTDANFSTVAEICRRLDGLPLAIELAAARIKLLSPQSLLERLEYALPVLTRGPIDRPDRQQAMHATIAWSFDLLSPDERTLLRRLSVFTGGCTFESAEAVCNYDTSLDIIGGIASLVDKSLLRCDGDEPRIRMLETVREFSLDELTRKGESDRLLNLHAKWSAGLARMAKTELAGANQRSWSLLVDREWANLRSALEWSLGLNDGELSYLIASGIQRYLRLRGRLGEGRTLLERTLTLNGPRDLRRAVLEGLTSLLYLQNDLDRSEEIARLQLNEARAAGDLIGVGIGLSNLSHIKALTGKLEDAKDFIGQFKVICDEIDDPSLLAKFYQVQGDLALIESDFRRARVASQKAADLFRSLGDLRSTATALNDLGSASMRLGDYSRAESALRESLALTSNIEDLYNAYRAIYELAKLALLRGDVATAVDACHDGLTRCSNAEDPTVEGYFRLPLGVAARVTGNLTEAELLLVQCQNAFTSIPSAAAQADLQLALVALAKADHGHAALLLTDALTKAHFACDRLTIADSLLAAARWAEFLGFLNIGTQLLGASRQVCSELGYVLGKWERESSEALEQSLRLSLGDDDFAQDYRRGLTLGWAEAVECALTLARDVRQNRIIN